MNVQILKAGLVYFSLVFGAGFILGIVRVLCLVPNLGTRTSELIEAPVMLAVIMLMAKWVISAFKIPPDCLKRLSVGVIALVLLLVMEFSVVLWLRGLTIEEYITSRDPIAGSVYVGMLIVFTALPIFIA